MRKLREAISTIADFTASAKNEMDEDGSISHRRNLSGGATMWQARLVLSTLPPTGNWAVRLRRAIRRGDEVLADQLLDAIYARNSTPPSAHDTAQTPTTPPSRTKTTVLPPAPGERTQVAS